MDTFADLIEFLSHSNDVKAVISRLIGYFGDTKPVEEKDEALRLMLGIYPKKAISSRQLRTQAADITGLPGWMIDRCVQEAGNFLKALSLLLHNSGCYQQSVPLTIVIEKLSELSNRENERIMAFIKNEVPKFHKNEMLLFLQLLCGSFRSPCEQHLVFIALSSILGIDHKILTLRFHLSEQKKHCTISQLENPVNDEQKLVNEGYLKILSLDNLSQLPKDHLTVQAFGVKSGKKAVLKKFGDTAVLWSENDVIISETYPALIHAAAMLPEVVSLFGQIIDLSQAFEKGGDQLSLGINDGKIGYFFEIWHFDTYHKSSQMLEDKSIFAETPYRLPKQLAFEDWAELEQKHNKCRLHGFSGILLKMQYPEQKHLFWQADNYVLKAILMYVELKGPGSSNIASATFGVYDDDKLVPVGKIDFAEENQIVEGIALFARQNTMERFGPVRTLRAVEVFELHFDTAFAATKRKSGVSLSNLIIQRRISGKPEDADDLQYLRKMLKMGNHRENDQ